MRVWEQLLHEALLVGLEGGELLGLGGDERVEGAEAVGDFFCSRKAGANI